MAHAHPAYECPGFGAAYDRVRPRPSQALLDLLCDLLGRRPEEQIGVGRLRAALGGRTLPVWWSYDVVVGSRA